MMPWQTVSRKVSVWKDCLPHLDFLKIYLMSIMFLDHVMLRKENMEIEEAVKGAHSLMVEK